MVPNTEEAVSAYQSEGGRLTLFPSFGVDPLADDARLQRRREFINECDFPRIFSELVNGNYVRFYDCITKALQL